MKYEFYFADIINEYTWKDFLIQMNKRKIEEFYQLIEGCGWKDNFSFNPNGEAFYVSAIGKQYKGIWFETTTTKIAIFGGMSIN